MSADDFSIHRDSCDKYDEGMPITDLPDEVTSVDDLECECWNAIDTLEELNS